MSKKSSVEAEAVRYFDLIYNEEKLMIELTAEERYEQCLLKVKPLLYTLFVYLHSELHQENLFRRNLKMLGCLLLHSLLPYLQGHIHSAI